MPFKIKIDPIPRAEGVSDRSVVVTLGARFMDELLSGLPTVLMPTIRAQLGLSYTQVSLLGLVLNVVSAVVEPINGLLIDLWKRPWLMAWGAAGIGLATAIIGLAPTFGLLVLGFAVYGLSSGPLAHTADVVLVESYPEAPDRIYTRSTLIDTAGALLSPLLVSLSFWFGLEWRWLMVSLGLSTLIYAAMILRTRFPAPMSGQDQEATGFGLALRANLSAVLSSRRALTWLTFLFVFSVAEAYMPFSTIWLREQVGMSQGLIGVYKALEMAVSIVSLIILDRWLARVSYRRILLISGIGVLFLYPLWLFLPGIGARFILVLPLNFLFTVFWPIARAQSLASVPGRGGTVTAIQSLLGFVPIPLIFGLLAERFSLTTTMFVVTTGAILLLILITLTLPSDKIKT